ncbi:MAG: response regulator [Gallionella sp.]|nr:response regulator [Gallionella sp.]
MNMPQPAKKATILLVDDVPDNLALMSSLLKNDYRVKIANSGEKALKIAASNSPPDLILLDIMMPGMDGFEVCQRLKRDPRTMNIPVIFVSAKAEEEDEQKGLELGAVDYITKPISPHIVMARVKNHLALKAMADFLRDQNDLDSAERLAYTLKGASGNVSITGLQHFAETLEVMLEERRSREGIDARPDAPATSLDNLIAQLDQKLPDKQGIALAVSNREKLKTVCGKLEALLTDGDAEAADVLDANAELLNDAFPNNARMIDNYIRSFDFEAALAALKVATGAPA